MNKLTNLRQFLEVKNIKKTEAKMIDGKLYFRNFMVQKESDNFYGVYESFHNSKCGEVITSGESMEFASKKAKLLQIGYNLRMEIEE